MYPNREVIYSALMTFLQKTTGAVTVSRTGLPEADIASCALPAIEQMPSSEDAVEQGANLRSKWKIKQPVTIYVDTTNPDIPGDAVVNNMLDAIETALVPSPVTGYQTLGGLVQWCRFRGVLLKDAGYQTGIGAALIALEILTTS